VNLNIIYTFYHSLFSSSLTVSHCLKRSRYSLEKPPRCSKTYRINSQKSAKSLNDPRNGGIKSVPTNLTNTETQKTSTTGRSSSKQQELPKVSQPCDTKPITRASHTGVDAIKRSCTVNNSIRTLVATIVCSLVVSEQF